MMHRLPPIVLLAALALPLSGCNWGDMHDTVSIKSMEVEPRPSPASVPTTGLEQPWPKTPTADELKPFEKTGEPRQRASRVPIPDSIRSTENPLRQRGKLSLKRGKKIFAQQCSHCHGKTGKGDGPVSGYLYPGPAALASDATQRQPEAALMWKVTMGIGHMPAFGRKLSPSDRWHVVAYILTLGHDRQARREQAAPSTP